jgi:hypothetical protein
MRWRTLASAGAEKAWLLEFDVTLSAPGSRPVVLGSPGSNGRADAGYGGFFWRLPRTDAMAVRSSRGLTGEQVHGTIADWLAVSLRTGAQAATIVVLPADAATAADRWFVRSTSYPGFGSALAWDAPVSVDPAQPLHRRFRAVIADGDLDPEGLVALLTT